MIWLVWRQHRKQALFALIGLGVLAAALLPTGREAHNATAAYNRCLDGLGDAQMIAANTASNCNELADKFGATHETWAYMAILLLFLPVLVGLFWGAPLVAREVEQGTHRLVWTQGITRRQWVFAKFGLVGAAVLVLASAYAYLVSWWMEPLNGTIANRMEYLFFDQQGIAPIGYTLFAVALGIFAGTLTRKVLPAMATTLVAFLAARIAVTFWVRPNLRAPLTQTAPVVSENPMVLNPALGDWVRASSVYNRDGTVRSVDSISFCVPGPDDRSCPDNGAYNGWTYQPAGDFWPLQYIETGLFVVLAAVLLYGALWQVRQRVT